MHLSCPPAPFVKNLAGNRMDRNQCSVGEEDGRRLEEPLQTTHHRASATETKKAGRAVFSFKDVVPIVWMLKLLE